MLNTVPPPARWLGLAGLIRQLEHLEKMAEDDELGNAATSANNVLPGR